MKKNDFVKDKENPHPHTQDRVGTVSSLSVCAAVVFVWEGLCNAASCLTL